MRTEVRFRVQSQNPSMASISYFVVTISPSSHIAIAAIFQKSITLLYWYKLIFSSLRCTHIQRWLSLLCQIFIPPDHWWSNFLKTTFSMYMWDHSSLSSLPGGRSFLLLAPILAVTYHRILWTWVLNRLGTAALLSTTQHSEEFSFGLASELINLLIFCLLAN